jgi:hypothetical protein
VEVEQAANNKPNIRKNVELLILSAGDQEVTLHCAPKPGEMPVPDWSFRVVPETLGWLILKLGLKA